MPPTLNMLIVDDNAKMRSMVAEIVKRKKINVLECTGGIDALGKYRIHQPDWILMEAKTERMDGLAATELIHQFFPKAKVMLISRENTPEIRRAAYHAGAAAFVPQENLMNILDRLYP